MRVWIAEEKLNCNEAWNKKIMLNKNFSGKHCQQNGLRGKQSQEERQCRGLGPLGNGQWDLKN